MEDTPPDAAPLVHIGYPKAGSTWLQRQVFPKKALGLSLPWGEQSPMLIEHLKVVDTFLFDEEIQNIRTYYDDGCRASIQDGCVPVISYEHVMLDPYGGKADRRESARRLKKIFPSSKIFLMIREQRSIILSSYTEHLRRGYTAKIDRFMGFDKLRRPGFGASCALEYFLYDRLITYLYDIFGKSNVLVLPIELIGTDEFVVRFYQFINKSVPDNFMELTSTRERRARKSDLVLLRYLNFIGTSRIVTKGDDSLLRKMAYGANLVGDYFIPEFLYQTRRTKVRDFISCSVHGYFNESNKRTSTLIDIDLSRLNYM